MAHDQWLIRQYNNNNYCHPNSLFFRMYNTTEKNKTSPNKINNLSTTSLLPNLVINLVDISIWEPIFFISVLDCLRTPEESTTRIQQAINKMNKNSLQLNI